MEPDERRKNWFWGPWYVLLGLLYPAIILLAIVATANHYWLDSVVAVGVSALAYAGNEVFILLLPAEDLLLWCLRLEKPVPSNGEGGRRRGEESR